MAEGGTVAILGAGMAGGAAAQRLAQAGLAVRIFDKGRGIGGRMATRRTGTGQRFDHGAQFFRAKGDAFRAQCATWIASGVAAPWGEDGRTVGLPGMPAPVRALLDGFPVSLETTIIRIARSEAGWMLTDADGVASGPFAAVGLTFPAPQVVALIAASGLVLPGPERATYAPCWSLLLDLDEHPGFSKAHLAFADGPIALIVREETKPGRAAGHALVAHAAPDWSRTHLEDPREAVRAALIGALEARLGRAVRPAYAAVHRWRYAMVETALGEPCLYDPAQRLGAAGDWCLGPRIEAAFDSGRALGERIVADLKGAR
ncbi:NAD(P)-binding protein [Methylobacterium sp. J-059]|uniref:NAD(P)/FAD-dependent oxidoreductase n=1 Tax=Methylobacterium sp. J-059 TaxID=2836643 RepID=UPI001FB98195|nr:NAD(P)-binding protein [Methylobacterium sp. J-059]MCJ2040049.1 NAD(P)-binding protein [Methylobacterium sp. J-059]